MTHGTKDYQKAYLLEASCGEAINSQDECRSTNESRGYKEYVIV
jgi:hypothetical protein